MSPYLPHDEELSAAAAFHSIRSFLMRSIGFSTGALALSDFRLALDELQGQPVDSIELSALRYRELQPLLSALETLPLVSYHYKSIHAPSSFDARQEVEIVDLLKRLVPREWPIILHPDTIHDYAVWRGFGTQLAIENSEGTSTGHRAG
jgi:hypothetical protein